MKRRPGLADKRIVQMALEFGAKSAKVIPASSVQTGSWVRWKCQFGCGCYGTSLVCPPNSPSPEETRKVLDEYDRAVLFEAARGEPKRIAVELERELFLAGFYKAMGLGAGPCRLCGTCAMEKGCRHPDEARPAMEACGIAVFATVRKHGFTINVVRDQTDPQHYFGLVLIE